MPCATAARERLLDAAATLFYGEGITATGVDRIVAEAGLSKPTLYAHFSSKAALVSAVLAERHRQQRASLQAHLTESDPTSVGRLLGVFDWLGAWHATEGARGCVFLNAAAEVTDQTDSAWTVIVHHKRWLRDQLVALSTEAGLANPADVGEELLLLVEGANARMLVEGDLEAAARAHRAAEAVVGAARLTGSVSDRE